MGKSGGGARRPSASVRERAARRRATPSNADDMLMQSALDSHRPHAEAGGAPAFTKVPRTNAERAAMGLYRERTLTDNRIQDIIHNELPAARQAHASATNEKQIATRAKAVAKLERERDRLTKRSQAIARQMEEPPAKSPRASNSAKAAPTPPSPVKPTGPVRPARPAAEKSFTQRAREVAREQAITKAQRAVREAELVNTLRRANGQPELQNTFRIARAGYEKLSGQRYTSVAPAIDASIRRAWARQAGGNAMTRQLESLGVWTPSTTPRASRAKKVGA